MVVMGSQRLCHCWGQKGFCTWGSLSISGGSRESVTPLSKPPSISKLKKRVIVTHFRFLVYGISGIRYFRYTATSVPPLSWKYLPEPKRSLIGNLCLWPCIITPLFECLHLPRLLVFSYLFLRFKGIMRGLLDVMIANNLLIMM